MLDKCPAPAFFIILNSQRLTLNLQGHGLSSPCFNGLENPFPFFAPFRRPPDGLSLGYWIFRVGYWLFCPTKRATKFTTKLVYNLGVRVRGSGFRENFVANFVASFVDSCILISYLIVYSRGTEPCFLTPVPPRAVGLPVT